MFVSVHLIIRETTNYGFMLVKAAIDSLETFPDELVIVNNGCRQDITDYLNSLASTKPYAIVHLHSDEVDNFSQLRNLAIKYTNPKADFCMFVDSDEIFYEGDLVGIKNKLGTTGLVCFWGSFYHLCYTPFYKFDEVKRHFIWPHNPEAVWKDSVHEVLSTWDEKTEQYSGLKWVHLGYTKSVVDIAIKWIHYAMLENGHTDRYKTGSVKKSDLLMIKNGIDQILCDRFSTYVAFDKKYPIYFQKILDYYNKTDIMKWQDWVTYHVDPQYGKFLDDMRRMQDWGRVIDYIAENKIWRTI